MEGAYQAFFEPDEQKKKEKFAKEYILFKLREFLYTFREVKSFCSRSE